MGKIPHKSESSPKGRITEALPVSGERPIAATLAMTAELSASRTSDVVFDESVVLVPSGNQPATYSGDFKRAPEVSSTVAKPQSSDSVPERLQASSGISSPSGQPPVASNSGTSPSIEVPVTHRVGRWADESDDDDEEVYHPLFTSSGSVWAPTRADMPTRRVGLRRPAPSLANDGPNNLVRKIYAFLESRGERLLDGEQWPANKMKLFAGSGVVPEDALATIQDAASAVTFQFMAGIIIALIPGYVWKKDMSVSLATRRAMDTVSGHIVGNVLNRHLGFAQMPKIRRAYVLSDLDHAGERAKLNSKVISFLGEKAGREFLEVIQRVLDIHIAESEVTSPTIKKVLSGRKRDLKSLCAAVCPAADRTVTIPKKGKGRGKAPSQLVEPVETVRVLPWIVPMVKNRDFLTGSETELVISLNEVLNPVRLNPDQADAIVEKIYDGDIKTVLNRIANLYAKRSLLAQCVTTVCKARKTVVMSAAGLMSAPIRDAAASVAAKSKFASCLEAERNKWLGGCEAILSLKSKLSSQEGPTTVPKTPLEFWTTYLL